MPKSASQKSDRAALITGGAKHFGRAFALMLAAEGFDIALHYHTSAKDALRTAKDIEALGAKCNIYKADLADSKTYAPLMKNVKKDFPKLELLVNNASIFERHTFLATTENMFDAHMDTNFKAPFFLTQAFAKNIKRGQVVNIVDTYVTKATPAYFSYLLSKKALYEFTRMAARALSPQIRVNAIAPGTTIGSKDMTQEYRAKKEAVLPMKKLNAREDVVAALKFLVHTESVTGECIFVDAGEQLI